MANLVIDGLLIDIYNNSTIDVQFQGQPIVTKNVVINGGQLVSDDIPGATYLGVYDDGTILRHAPGASAPLTK